MAVTRAFLIDGTAFCYRAFYAIRSLSTSDGRPSNAVYGFARMLATLREQQQPDYLAVAFDVGKPTFRHKKFEAYKVQRKPMPEPLISQLPMVKRLLAAYRIPAYERAGYEAEDVLATIAGRIAQDGVEIYLVTGDKDALQLVNSHVKVYNPHQGEAVVDAAGVMARYGVRPDQVVDLMALMGDEIDNIPGVPGIGAKTAGQLLRQFGSLDALFNRLEEVENATRRAHLAAARRQVELARELARIDADVPIDVRLSDLMVQEPDWKALRAFFRELEFKQLLRSLDAQAPAAAGRGAHETHLAKDARGLETLLAQLAGMRRAPTAVLCWPLAPSDALTRAAGPGPQAAAQARGSQELPQDAEPVMALACDPAAAWLVPLTRAALSTTPGRQLSDWLADPLEPKVGHDMKAAVRRLGQIGITLRGIAGDTMLAAYLLNPARTSQTLNDLADEHLDECLVPVPQAVPPPAVEHPGAAEAWGRAASSVLRLHDRLVEKLRAAGLSALYSELELPLIRVLAQMEATGLAVDLPYLTSLRATMEATLAQQVQEIHRLAGCAFNVNSPKQLAQVLFERLNLPVVKRTKTGPSTDSDVLQQLAEQHPLPRHLMQYRELAKLVSTYLMTLPALVDPATGRIHTSFNQAATSTGRLSSSDPNLQNIPIKTDLGRSIRRAFIPGIPEGIFVAVDYSQIELRVLAHLSGDEQLAEAFRQGRDIHRATAALIYGIPEPDIQPEQRNAMKAINYGILYGMSAHGLSKELGMPFEESQAFIDAYFARYPKVRAYLDCQVAQARRDGFVQTLLGRRRYIPEVHSPDAIIRQLGERMAINAPIQGTAADLIKRAMVQVASRLDAEPLGSRMVLQVHDELVFECPRAELAALIQLVRPIMEGAITLRVPLAVTVKAGPNWLDLAPVA